MPMSLVNLIQTGSWGVHKVPEALAVLDGAALVVGAFLAFAKV
jgi:hypothetical protein